MITAITIRNFKSIQEVVNLPLGGFHILVGPNASGKSTFLDALHFVRDCLDVGPLKAVEKARAVGRLQRNNSTLQNRGDLFKPSDAITEWTDHLRYALPSLQEIGWDRRGADNAEFLVLKYDNGLECPSWLTSDGTLRMLALTLPAFLPTQPGIYMVEEPENGVHPKGIEIILNALGTIPDAQVLVATHSPLVVQQVGVEKLLCFSATPNGSRIMPGSQHPALKEWDGTPDLATIFSAGILE